MALVQIPTPVADSGSMTLLSTTTLSGFSTTISSIPQTYKHLFMLVDGIKQNSVASVVEIKLNNTSTYYTGVRSNTAGTTTTYGGNLSITGDAWDYGSDNGKLAYWVYDYASTTPSPGHKAVAFSGMYVPGSQGFFSGGGGRANSAAITSIVIASSSTSFSGGTVRLYGVN